MASNSKWMQYSQFAVGAGSAGMLIYIGMKKPELSKNVRRVMIGIGFLSLALTSYSFLQIQLTNNKIARTIDEMSNVADQKLDAPEENPINQ